MERAVTVAGLFVAVCGMAILGWLAAQPFRAGVGRFDGALRSLVHEHSSEALTSAMKFISFVGSSVVIIPIAVGALFVCLFTRRFHAFRTLAAAVFGALLLEGILKNTFHRARPHPFFDVALPRSYSLPSGHALFSMCFLGGLLIAFTPRLPAKRWIAIWIATASLILAIGFSRVYLGVHYPSDVIAGYGVGIVWLATLQVADRLHRKNVRTE
jgi:undecaprenyl-diphosphatase